MSLDKTAIELVPSVNKEQQKSLHSESAFTLIRAGEVQTREWEGERRQYYCNPLVDLVVVTFHKPHHEPPHLHGVNQETYYVIRGMLRMNIAGTYLELFTGDMAIVPPGVCHGFETIGEEVAFLAIKKEVGIQDKQPCET